LYVNNQPPSLSLSLNTVFLEVDFTINTIFLDGSALYFLMDAIQSAFSQAFDNKLNNAVG
jgi:hypothetical protein